MSLRLRLILSLVGAGFLMVGLVAVARWLIVERSAERELRSELTARVDAIGRERCEEGLVPGPLAPPFRPGGGRPGPPPLGPRRHRVEVLFYGRDFAPRIEGSPPLPPDVRGHLEKGEGFVAAPMLRRGPEGLVGAIPTGWDSEACAYAVASMPQPPPLLPLTFLVLAPLAFLGALAGALYVAAGAPVRRIRALAQGVRRAADSRYAEGVAVEGVDEIAGLAVAFNDAAGTVRAHVLAVEERERVLRDFVAHTTHDVGVPLSVLAGSLTEMRDRATSVEGLAPLLDAASRETRYIGSLVHNLGAVVRLETEDGLPERHPVDMAALVERVALRHGEAAREARVELNHAVPDTPVRVLGDVTLLEQAASNLVHNAIRYNRPGGHVAVVLDADGPSFALRVTDDGPGVSDEERARLGAPRFRGGDARSRRPEGSGLGLWIARSVASRHGLDLEFRRPEAGGFEAILSGPSRTESQG